MAIFQKFSKIENGSERRQELQGTFQTMQRETRSLLCLIESVINGTRQANRNRAVAGEKPRGFSESAGAAIKAKRPAYRYYTQQVMERKLKGLTDELTEDKLLNIAKVVFFNYKEFVTKVSAKAKLRVERIEKRKAAAVGKGNGALARNKVNQGGGGEKNTIQNHNNNKSPMNSDSVTKRPLEAALRRNKNKNKNNNNNNNVKLNKQRKRLQNKKLRQMEGRRKERGD